jgi:acyl-homoserine-lactone acylase
VRSLLAALTFCVLACGSAHAAAPTEAERWRAHTAATTITRDDWGIAHVHGGTDADAVFGMAYAQAEDDFYRVEMNYIDAMGRRAETEGEAAIWSDLRVKLYVDPDDLKARYATSPLWLKRLMTAWADGLNFYLSNHPGAHPKLFKRFEPWMALSFTEGSIGPDYEQISLSDLAAFYGGGAPVPPQARADWPPEERSASNGIAIAPSITRDGHALLLINPHTTFFFRSELQMQSDEGLNAYGAVTWGQLFIYQGFNAHAGWMHTSTGVDNIDRFDETVVRKDDRLFYRYGAELRPVSVKTIAVPYRAGDGSMASRRFTIYRTHHGPVVADDHGRWQSIALMYRPVEALEQSFLRTKAHDYASFMQVEALKANSSNNTLFADSKGEIAYLHPQFVPVRDDRFDYTRPVDGADPATDWRGLTPLDKLPSVVNPPNGWVYNSNDWPYQAAGSYSPKQADFPRYMDQAGESPRGLHAVRVLNGKSGFTLQGLREAAYDSYLTGFADLAPRVVAAFDALPKDDPQRAALDGPVELLRHWDYRWSTGSEATSLAVFWGTELIKEVDPQARHSAVADFWTADRDTSPAQKLNALARASERLEREFGSWRTPWGEINRFQRINGDLHQPFDDSKPSLAVGFPYSVWGTLASFAARPYPGTKRWYGTSGNSFVAVVEFGPRVRAIAVSAGGESGHPSSKHFDEQAGRYVEGDLREVYFYPDQLKGHVERTYHPGG